jgi:16S rRNA (adenine1518-N6/adenine1519-N6)-dimethyltransferase
LEKDQKLWEWLFENNKSSKISYFHADALRINWPEFCSEHKGNWVHGPESSLIIVGNLPYYITNSLIVNLLLNYHLFKSLVFLVQKEVGQKWVANPNRYSSKYSALSVFISCLTEAKIGLEIPARIFTPSPPVDGVLVIIKPRPNISFAEEKFPSFLRFLKNCFCFRRKTLLNNLYSFAGNWKSEWKKHFAENNYPEKIRPQDLTPPEYSQLFLFWKGLQ